MSHSDQALLDHAITQANIPTLLMVLVQMTGDTHWLDAPYQINRQSGMGDNDSGGLDATLQAEVRTAAIEAIRAWQNGKPLAIENPPPELLVRMLSNAMGERVPDEYGEFTAAQLSQKTRVVDPIYAPDDFRVLVVGSGATGMCAAVHLQQAGIPFSVVEKADRVGGVWYENKYPGAGVDTPNHLYSFSFVSYDWPMYFALRDDLQTYMEHVAKEFDLLEHVRLRTEVVKAEWNDAEKYWNVTLEHDGEQTIEQANVLLSATGIFNPPVWPNIPGIEDFEGPIFHTSDWPQDLSLADKNVAVIGNGASAMQICPEIQDEVASLTIYQRSTHWAAPFDQFRKVVPDAIRYLLREVPLYRAWYRVRLGWTFNDRMHEALQKDPDWIHPDRSLNAINDAHRAFFARYIEQELGDRKDLLEKVLPPYPPFGKRMLMDNGWYRMLRNEKVALIDRPIVEITQNEIKTKTEAITPDVLVIATGFDVLNFGTAFEARGRSGQTLTERWGDNASAYLGTAIPDFPNLFMLYGPNTQPGHGGSLLFVIERQMHYIMDMLKQMCEQGLSDVEIRSEVHAQYNQAVDAAHEKMVWTHPGMQTYYRNSQGRVVVNFPWRNVDLFEMTKQVNLQEYLTA
ncbi:MAG: NAD(P)/FAD-dependent oxidoreductase [Pseudomonadota bacterium]|nr:NAD(P)/FAD-dependent oxidoreductase [Pseudomonadota bacterium]